MDNQKASKRTWYHPRAPNSFAARPAPQFQQKEPQQQQAKKNFETSDRTQQNILRHVYPINNSGSKQLVIGHNPGAGFKPTITIRKPGFKGVSLNHKASGRFLEELVTLHGYFENENKSEPVQPINLDLGAIVELDYFAGKKAIFVKVEEEDSKVGCVILTAASINFIVAMKDLLQFIFARLNETAADVERLYFTMQGLVHAQPDIKEKILKSLMPSDLPHAPNLMPGVDFIRVFLEIKKYCELELLS